MSGPDLVYLQSSITIDGQVIVAMSTGLFIAAAAMMVIRKSIKIANRS